MVRVLGRNDRDVSGAARSSFPPSPYALLGSGLFSASPFLPPFVPLPPPSGAPRTAPNSPFPTASLSPFLLAVFLVLLMLPILIIRDSIKRFRGGVLGLVTLALVQLFSIANTFTYFNSVHSIRGATLARARVVLAGCITSSIGIGIVWLIASFRDEQSSHLNEKRIDAPIEGADNTRGGLYETEPEAVSYANPVAET